MTEPKSIFDVVMPDWHELWWSAQKTIKELTCPKFAEEHASELSPRFIFFAITRWNLLDDDNLEEKINQWFSAAAFRNLDFIYICRSLLIVLELKRDEIENCELIQDIIIKSLIKAHPLPKTTSRLLKLVDNRGKETDTLKLCGTFIAEEGIPRLGLPPTSKQSAEDKIMIEEYTKLIIKLLEEQKKLRAVGEDLSSDKQKQLNYYRHSVYKNRQRYDYPLKDKAASTIRSNLKKLKECIDQNYPLWLAGNYLRGSFKTGRKCVYKGPDKVSTEPLCPNLIHTKNLTESKLIDFLLMNWLNSYEKCLVKVIYEAGMSGKNIAPFFGAKD
ncbi:MAG: hypothetical protein RBR69_00420 [Candidatus Cloacimonadaceae bacterium]|nr:hypothetical protein [Candidatus Cloacimonadaceae bacterium]